MEYSINFGRELNDQMFIEFLRSYATDEANETIELVEILLKHGLHIEEIGDIFAEFKDVF